MKITVKIQGKSHEKELPVRWEEVKFKTFLKFAELAKEPDDVNNSIKILSIITELDEELLRTALINNLDQVLHILSFMRQEVPKVIPEIILGYKVPKDLGFESLGQFEDLKGYLKESSSLSEIDQFRRYIRYCAVYACADKHGKYDWRLCEAMEEEFLEAPAPEVLGIGNFTLAKLIGLNYTISPNYRRPITRWKRFKLALKRWALHLGLQLRWLFLKRKLAIRKTNY